MPRGGIYHVDAEKPSQTEGPRMCSDSRGPSPSAFIRNLQQPMPLPRKVLLAIKNMSLKVVKLRPCCGHHGEPGC